PQSPLTATLICRYAMECLAIGQTARLPKTWWSYVLIGRAPKEALRACLPASGARTGWDPAWPGLAGILGFGELRLARGSPYQSVPLLGTCWNGACLHSVVFFFFQLMLSRPNPIANRPHFSVSSSPRPGIHISFRT